MSQSAAQASKVEVEDTEFDPFVPDLDEDPFISDAEVKEIIESGKQIRTLEEEEAKLREFDADDRGSADAVNYLYGGKICYVSALGWLVWNGTHYKKAADKVWCMVEDGLRQRRLAAVNGPRDENKKLISEKDETIIKITRADAHRVRGVMESLQARVTREIEEFDSNPDCINVKNGVLNLRTRELTPHNADQLYTYCAPVSWNEEADYSEWVEFLEENVEGGKEVVNFLQEAVGYTLTGYTSDECFFYVEGGGRAGKGTFVQSIKAILGEPLASGVPFSTFSQKRGGADSQNFDLAPLKAARFVVASESQRGEKLNEAFVKDITGDGTVRCAHKGKDWFEYKPLWKIWLTSNWPPKGDTEDGAFWTRMRYVRFPNERSEDQADPEVKKRFLKPEILQGTLRWAVEGAERWYKNGKLTVPETSKEKKKEKREANDSVGQWLEECTNGEPVEDLFTPTKVVRASYAAWCTENGYFPKGPENFNEAIRRRGFTPQQTKWHEGKSQKGVLGLLVL